MKVRDVSEGTKVEFKPIKLEVEIQSVEEACNLWHRLQASDTQVKEISKEAEDDENYPPFKFDNGSELWAAVNVALRHRGVIS